MEKPAPPSLWVKLDIIGKIISGVVLAAIALVLKLGAEDIAQSMASGQLVQSLIADLSSRGTARQDVALIALNHAIGEENPRMVAEIAERVIRDIAQAEDMPAEQQGSLFVTAFAVLEERNPTRARDLADSILPSKRRDDPEGAKALENYILADAAVAAPDRRAALRSDPEGSKPPEQPALLLGSFKNLVYLQFLQEEDRDLVEKLRSELVENNFQAPGIEQVTADFRNAVRFFHPGDARTAQELADRVGSFFQRNGYDVRFQVEDLSRRGFDVPQGQMEVWINLWHSKPPTTAWCYQEREIESTGSQSFGVHCHWSQGRCDEAKAGSRRATACRLVRGLDTVPWMPSARGFMDSWFQTGLARPFGPPLPELRRVTLDVRTRDSSPNTINVVVTSRDPAGLTARSQLQDVTLASTRFSGGDATASEELYLLPAELDAAPYLMIYNEGSNGWDGSIDLFVDGVPLLPEPVVINEDIENFTVPVRKGVWIGRIEEPSSP